MGDRKRNALRRPGPTPCSRIPPSPGTSSPASSCAACRAAREALPCPGDHRAGQRRFDLRPVVPQVCKLRSIAVHVLGIPCASAAGPISHDRIPSRKNSVFSPFTVSDGWCAGYAMPRGSSEGARVTGLIEISDTHVAVPPVLHRSPLDTRIRPTDAIGLRGGRRDRSAVTSTACTLHRSAGASRSRPRPRAAPSRWISVQTLRSGSRIVRAASCCTAGG